MPKQQPPARRKARILPSLGGPRLLAAGSLVLGIDTGDPEQNLQLLLLAAELLSRRVDR